MNTSRGTSPWRAGADQRFRSPPRRRLNDAQTEAAGRPSPGCVAVGSPCGHTRRQKEGACVVVCGFGGGVGTAEVGSAMRQFGSVAVVALPGDSGHGVPRVAFVRFRTSSAAAACLSHTASAGIRVHGRVCRVVPPNVVALRSALATPQRPHGTRVAAAAADGGWWDTRGIRHEPRVTQAFEVPCAIHLALALEEFLNAPPPPDHTLPASVAAAAALVAASANAVHDDGQNNASDVAEALMHEYDQDRDTLLCFREFVRLCEDLGLRPPSSEEEFAEQCQRLGLSNGVSTDGLRQLAGGALRGSVADVWRIVAAKRVASLVYGMVHNSVCPGKCDADELTSVTEVDLSAMARRVVDLWYDKEGDVVDELLTNLSAPARVKTTNSTLSILAAAATSIERRCEGKFSANLAELLVLALYTMAGPDIDRLMTFSNAPRPHDKDPDGWAAYVGKFKWRNAALFSCVNRAMREAATAEPDAAVWGTLGRWIRVIGLLHAAAATGDAAVGKDLYRGLAGLPQRVYDAHAALAVGARVDWAAFSSCATNPEPAESYIKGTAANAEKSSGGAAMFAVVGDAPGRGFRAGVPLEAVSSYPKEAEVLLPAFSCFEVAGRQPWEGLPEGTVSAQLRYNAAGRPDLERWVADCKEDGARAAERLRAAGQDLRELERELREQLQADDGGPRWPEKLNYTVPTISKEFYAHLCNVHRADDPALGADVERQLTGAKPREPSPQRPQSPPQKAPDGAATPKKGSPPVLPLTPTGAEAKRKRELRLSLGRASSTCSTPVAVVSFAEPPRLELDSVTQSTTVRRGHARQWSKRLSDVARLSPTGMRRMLERVAKMTIEPAMPPLPSSIPTQTPRPAAKPAARRTPAAAGPPRAARKPAGKPAPATRRT